MPDYWLVRCRHCRRPIEGCVGRYGDWMHADGRAEQCAGGATLAEPELAGQMNNVHNGREKAGR